jgi:hypothetical protein
MGRAKTNIVFGTIVLGMLAAWRRWLDSRLDDWNEADPADRALLDQALTNIATKLLEDHTREQETVPA